MSGRRSKKSQKLGSSRRGTRGDEVHTTNQSDGTVLPAQFDQVPSLNTDNQTTALKCSPHAESSVHMDLEAELPERKRKIGSTRKKTGGSTSGKKLEPCDEVTTTDKFGEEQETHLNMSTIEEHTYPTQKEQRNQTERSLREQNIVDTFLQSKEPDAIHHQETSLYSQTTSLASYEIGSNMMMEQSTAQSNVVTAAETNQEKQLTSTSQKRKMGSTRRPLGGNRGQKQENTKEDVCKAEAKGSSEAEFSMLEEMMQTWDDVKRKDVPTNTSSHTESAFVSKPPSSERAEELDVSGETETNNQTVASDRFSNHETLFLNEESVFKLGLETNNHTEDFNVCQNVSFSTPDQYLLEKVSGFSDTYQDVPRHNTSDDGGSVKLVETKEEPCTSDPKIIISSSQQDTEIDKLVVNEEPLSSLCPLDGATKDDNFEISIDGLTADVGRISETLESDITHIEPTAIDSTPETHNETNVSDSVCSANCHLTNLSPVTGRLYNANINLNSLLPEDSSCNVMAETVVCSLSNDLTINNEESHAYVPEAENVAENREIYVEIKEENDTDVIETSIACDNTVTEIVMDVENFTERSGKPPTLATREHENVGTKTGPETVALEITDQYNIQVNAIDDNIDNIIDTCLVTESSLESISEETEISIIPEDSDGEQKKDGDSEGVAEEEFLHQNIVIDHNIKQTMMVKKDVEHEMTETERRSTQELCDDVADKAEKHAEITSEQQQSSSNCETQDDPENMMESEAEEMFLRANIEHAAFEGMNDKNYESKEIEDFKETEVAEHLTNVNIQDNDSESDIQSKTPELNKVLTEEQNDTSSDINLDKHAEADSGLSFGDLEESHTKLENINEIPEDSQKESQLNKRKMGSTHRPLRGNKGQRKDREQDDKSETLNNEEKEHEREISEEKDAGPVEELDSTLIQSSYNAEKSIEESICDTGESQTTTKLYAESQENAGDVESVPAGGDTEVHLEIQTDIQMFDSTIVVKEMEENISDGDSLTRHVKFVGETFTVQSNMTVASDFLQNNTSLDTNQDALKSSENVDTGLLLKDVVLVGSGENTEMNITSDNSQGDSPSKLNPLAHKRKMGSTRRPLRGNKEKIKSAEEKEDGGSEGVAEEDTHQHSETQEQNNVIDDNIIQTIDVRDNEEHEMTERRSTQELCDDVADEEEGHVAIISEQQQRFSLNISETQNGPPQDDSENMPENVRDLQEEKDEENENTANYEKMFAFADINSEVTVTPLTQNQLFLQTTDEDVHDYIQTIKHVYEESEGKEMFLSTNTDGAFDSRNEIKDESKKIEEDFKETEVAEHSTNINIQDNDSQKDIQTENPEQNKISTEEQNNTSPHINLEELQETEHAENVSAVADSGFSFGDLGESHTKLENINEIPEDFQKDEEQSKIKPLVHKRKMGSTRRPLKGNKGRRKDREQDDESETLNEEKEQEREICEEKDAGPVEELDSTIIQSSYNAEKSIEESICDIRESQTDNIIQTKDVRDNKEHEMTATERRSTQELCDDVADKVDEHVEITSEQQQRSSSNISETQDGPPQDSENMLESERDVGDKKEEETKDTANDEEIITLEGITVTSQTQNQLFIQTTDEDVHDYIQTVKDVYEESEGKEQNKILTEEQNNRSPHINLEKPQETERAENVSAVADSGLSLGDLGESHTKLENINEIPEDSQKGEEQSKIKPIVHKRKMGSTRRPLRGNKGQRKDREQYDESDTLNNEEKEQERGICEEKDAGPVEELDSTLIQSSYNAEKSIEESICDTGESQTTTKLYAESQENAGDVESVPAGGDTEENTTDDNVLRRHVEFVGETFTVKSSVTSESEFLQNNTSLDTNQDALKSSQNVDAGLLLKDVVLVGSGENTEMNITSDNSQGDSPSKLNPLAHKRKMGSTRRPLRGNKEKIKSAEEKEDGGSEGLAEEDTHQHSETQEQNNVIDDNIIQTIDVRDNEEHEMTEKRSTQKLCDDVTDKAEGHVEIISEQQQRSLANISETQDGPPQDDSENMLESVRDVREENNEETKDTANDEEIFTLEGITVTPLTQNQLFLQTTDEDVHDYIQTIKHVYEESEGKEMFLSTNTDGAFDSRNETKDESKKIEEDFKETEVAEHSTNINIQVNDSQSDLQTENPEQNKILTEEQNNTSPHINLEELQETEHAENVSAVADSGLSLGDLGESHTKLENINEIPEDSQKDEEQSKIKPIVHKRKMGSTRRPLKGNKGRRKDREQDDESETLNEEKEQEREICEEKDAGPVEELDSTLIQSSYNAEKSIEESICDTGESQTTTKLYAESQENAGDVESVPAGGDTEVHLEIQTDIQMFDSTIVEERTDENISDGDSLTRHVEFVGETFTVQSNTTVASDFLQNNTSLDTNQDALKSSENVVLVGSGENTEMNITSDNSQGDSPSKLNPLAHKRKMGSTRRPLRGNKEKIKIAEEKEDGGSEGVAEEDTHQHSETQEQNNVIDDNIIQTIDVRDNETHEMTATERRSTQELCDDVADKVDGHVEITSEQQQRSSSNISETQDGPPQDSENMLESERDVGDKKEEETKDTANDEEIFTLEGITVTPQTQNQLFIQTTDEDVHDYIQTVKDVYEESEGKEQNNRSPHINLEKPQETEHAENVSAVADSGLSLGDLEESHTKLEKINEIPEDSHKGEEQSKIKPIVHKRKMGSTRRPLRGNKEKIKIAEEKEDGGSEGVAEEDTHQHSQSQDQNNVIDDNIIQTIDVRDNEEHEMTETMRRSTQKLCDKAEGHAEITTEQQQRSLANICQTQDDPQQDDSENKLGCVRNVQEEKDEENENTSANDEATKTEEMFAFADINSEVIVTSQTQNQATDEVVNDYIQTVKDVYEESEGKEMFLSTNTDAAFDSRNETKYKSKKHGEDSHSNLNPVVHKRKMGSTRRPLRGNKEKEDLRKAKDEDVEPHSEMQEQNDVMDRNMTQEMDVRHTEEETSGTVRTSVLCEHPSENKEWHSGITLEQEQTSSSNISQTGPSHHNAYENLPEIQESNPFVLSEALLVEEKQIHVSEQVVTVGSSPIEDGEIHSVLRTSVQKRKMGSTRKTQRGQRMEKERELGELDGETKDDTIKPEENFILEEVMSLTITEAHVHQQPSSLPPNKEGHDFENNESKLDNQTENPEQTEMQEQNDPNSNTNPARNQDQSEIIISNFQSNMNPTAQKRKMGSTRKTLRGNGRRRREVETKEMDGDSERTSEEPSTEFAASKKDENENKQFKETISTKSLTHPEATSKIFSETDYEMKKVSMNILDLSVVSEEIQSNEAPLETLSADLQSEMLVSADEIKVGEKDHSEPSEPENLEESTSLKDVESEHQLQLTVLDQSNQMMHSEKHSVTPERRRKMGSTRKNFKGKREEKSEESESKQFTPEEEYQDGETSVVREAERGQIIHLEQSDSSLLSEIERALNKTSSSQNTDYQLIIKEPNLANTPTETSHFNTPENSEPEQGSDKEKYVSLQVTESENQFEISSTGRRRKMGSTRKNPRQQLQAKREEENSEDEMDEKNKQEPKSVKKDLEAAEEFKVHDVRDNEEKKEYLDVPVTLTNTCQTEESTNSVTQESTSPSTKRKFGSRRTNIGKRDLDGLESNDDLTEDTAARLVSLDQMMKASKHDRSPGKTQTADLKNISDMEVVQFNVVMVGNSYVGKTSFVRRFHGGQFSPDFSSTIGVDTCVQNVVLHDRVVKLQIWDTAGQERFHSITTQVFHRADGLLLMYEITSSKSFISVRDWISQVQEKAPDNVIMMLLGNKSDCPGREVQVQEGEDLAREYKINFMECSAATGDNVSECMKSLAEMLVERNRQKMEEHTALKREQPQKKSGCC